MIISVEGIDGSGKTTQARLLAESLAILSRHPCWSQGAGGKGREGIGTIVEQELTISGNGDPALCCRPGGELLAKVIGPAVKAGRLIICDRYIDSTLAYQGYGLGGELDWIRDLNCRVVGSLTPSLTFLLDLPVERAAARRPGKADRVEQRETGFQQRVRRGYLELASLEEERFVILDALQSPEELRQVIWEQVQRRCLPPPGVE